MDRPRNIRCDRQERDGQETEPSSDTQPLWGPRGSGSHLWVLGPGLTQSPGPQAGPHHVPPPPRSLVAMAMVGGLRELSEAWHHSHTSRAPCPPSSWGGPSTPHPSACLGLLLIPLRGSWKTWAESEPLQPTSPAHSGFQVWPRPQHF